MDITKQLQSFVKRAPQHCHNGVFYSVNGLVLFFSEFQHPFQHTLSAFLLLVQPGFQGRGTSSGLTLTRKKKRHTEATKFSIKIWDHILMSSDNS